MKTETARKLFGSRHNIHGQQFKEAMNEMIFVFSDRPSVTNAIDHLWKVLETPASSRSPNAADDALTALMKAICSELGIKFRNLSDAYFLRCFSTPNPR